MWNVRLDEAQAGIKIIGRNINNLRYADDTTLMSENEKELEPLDESEKGEWKNWLKTQHLKNEDHGISPITSWQTDGETMEPVTDFIFLGSKITVDGDCSHETKMLSPWKKSYDQPRQCIKKQRHYFAKIW